MFRKIPNKIIYFVLTILLAVIIFFSLCNGAVKFSMNDVVRYLSDYISGSVNKNDTYEGIFLLIRLPRILLVIVTGAVLSVSGFLMQSIFRNPIVEPGIIGTSAGAALGAAIVFVFGKVDFFSHISFLSGFLLPACAFAGGLLATYLVYWFSASLGKINVISMVLAGIAVNAVAGGGTGILSYIARDPQARSITFWNLGTFSGADWNSVVIVYAAAIPSLIFILLNTKALNALILGETEAGYLGINIERLKFWFILVNTLMVSIATSMVGVISFVGLIVPHIFRLLKGSDSRFLTITSALAGAGLMLLADLLARLMVSPAEIPIGIITAFIGAPLFLFLLKHMRKKILSGGIYAGS